MKSSNHGEAVISSGVYLNSDEPLEATASQSSVNNGDGLKVEASRPSMSDVIVEIKNGLKSNGHHTHASSNHHAPHNTSNQKPRFKVEIPRITSRDLRSQNRQHSPPPSAHFEQISRLFCDHGAKREANKLADNIKLKSDLEEGIKKSKKFAMEQSVRFALLKQQQQQQKQQLELIKKQQALLLMCRYVFIVLFVYFMWESSY